MTARGGVGDALRSTSPRTAAAIAVAGVAVLLASSLPPPSRLFSYPDRGDIALYFDYAQRTFEGQVPYRDFTVEYPPGFLATLLAPGPADHGYYDRFRVLMLVLGAAAVVLLVVVLFLAGAGAVELAAGVLVFATLPLTLTPDLVFERFDLWPAVLVLLALAALLCGRRTVGLAALGVGTAAKLYPLAIVPLAILARRGRAHVRRDLAVVASAALVLVLPFAIVAPRGVGHVGWLLVRRPLHVESLGGSILLVAHRLGIYEPTIYLSFAGSWDFARTSRGPRELLLASAAAVVGFVVFGKVFSPQYLVWVAAVTPLALGRVRVFALSATVVVALLTRYIYDDGYNDLLQAGRTSWVMFARNVVLFALFCSLVLELAARARANADTPTDAVTTSDTAAL
jgi:Glycosyltransferase family 87